MAYLVDCKQKKTDCIMCIKNGKCSALNNTDFKDRECPFYKKRDNKKE